MIYIIQNLCEWNNSKLEPDWHKRYYFITRNKNKYFSFADNHVIIADSKDNLQMEYLHYKTWQKILEWEYHQKNLRQ